MYASMVVYHVSVCVGAKNHWHIILMLHQVDLAYMLRSYYVQSQDKLQCTCK